jgi:hypothetical protein
MEIEQVYSFQNELAMEQDAIKASKLLGYFGIAILENMERILGELEKGCKIKKTVGKHGESISLKV